MVVPSYTSIVKGAGLFGAAKAVNILTALVRTKFAAVLLGTAGVGLNALFNTVQLFMNQLLGLGLSTGSVKTLSEAYSTHDLAFIDGHVTRVRHWAIVCGGAAVALLALLSPLLSLLYFDTLHYVPHFMLLGVGVAALIVSDIEMSVMRSLQRSARLAFSMLLTALCALVFTVPFYWWLGVRGVIFAIVACAVASACICLWQGHKTHPFRFDAGQFADWRRFWDASQPMLRMGMAFVVTGLFLQGSDLLLQSVLATTASLTVVGLFKAGYQCAFTYPSMIFAGVANDYFPRLSAVRDDDVAGRRIVVVRQIRVMFLIALPVVIAIWLLAPWVIRILLSEEFLPLVTMVRWSVLAILFKAIYLPLGYLPLALNKRLHFVVLEGLSCLINILVVLAGYYLGGLDGIGIGIFVGGFLDLVLYILFCRYHYK